MWGSPGFVLPARSSVSGMSEGVIGGSLIGRFTWQEPIAVGESWDPLPPPPSFLQNKHPHAGSSSPPLTLGIILHSSLHGARHLALSVPAAVHICLGRGIHLPLVHMLSDTR